MLGEATAPTMSLDTSATSPLDGSPHSAMSTVLKTEPGALGKLDDGKVVLLRTRIQTSNTLIGRDTTMSFQC